MKILCVIDSLGSGGAQRQLVELALGLKKNGNDVSFLVYHRLNFFNDVLDKEQIQVNYIDEKNYLKRLFKMRQFIRGGSFDAVLSFLEAANFICEIAGLPWRKWRLIVGERSANPNIRRSFKLRTYRWFHFFADYVVANSHANIEMVKKINPLLPKNKCKVIYNIVDFEKWKPATDYIPRKDGKFKVVVAASHQYLKNLNVLIEAVNLLSDRDKKQLVIEWYGDKIDKPYFDNSYSEGQNKIEEYGLSANFTFYTATKQIAKKFQYADAVGLFSFYEGFPNIVCEAMACAKPVICSNISDLPTIIDNSNLVFNPKDSNNIKEVLIYLINLDREELVKIGNKNMTQAKTYFEGQNSLKNYLSIFYDEN